MKEKPQNEPRFETDFMLNFAMYSADLICVDGSVLLLRRANGLYFSHLLVILKAF